MGTFHRGIHGTLLRPKNQKCCPQVQSAGGSELDLLGTITPWPNLVSPVYFCIFLCAATVIFTSPAPTVPCAAQTQLKCHFLQVRPLWTLPSAPPFR